MDLVFWAVMPHCWACGSSHFSGAQCLHLSGLRDQRKFLLLYFWKIRNNSCSNAGSHPSRSASTAPLWKPQHSLITMSTTPHTPPLVPSTSWLIQNSTTTQINMSLMYTILPDSRDINIIQIHCSNMWTHRPCQISWCYFTSIIIILIFFSTEVRIT